MSYDYIHGQHHTDFNKLVGAYLKFPQRVLGGPRWIVKPGQLEPCDPHIWYHAPDSREGWLNFDEAQLLYRNIKLFDNPKGLEIGSAVGFSAYVMLSAGVSFLHMLDPVFAEYKICQQVQESLSKFVPNFELISMPGHIGVVELGRQGGLWQVVLIDGNHTAPYPALDAIAAEAFCAPNAMIFLHDTCYDGPKAALGCLTSLGWNAKVYQTSRRLAVCWRGCIEPIEHTPDPELLRRIS